MRRAMTLLALLLCVLAASRPCRAQTCGDSVRVCDEECDDANTVGGDGCAANCTLEHDLTCTLAQGSGTTLMTTVFSVPTALTGQIVLTVGGVRAGAPADPVPFVIRVDGSYLGLTQIAGIGASCTTVGDLSGWGPGNAGGGLIDCGSARVGDIDVSVSVDSTEPAPTPTVARSGGGTPGGAAFEIG
ncbi:MAG: hypothetical protein ABI629_21540 [bacterium]